MKMKKTLSFFVATVLALTSMCGLLSACTPTEDSTKEPEVTGIEITTAPTKVAYVLGQTFDPAGMVVSKLYDDETKEALAATEYTYTPNGALQLSDNKITIKYEDFTCTQKITVTNNVVSVAIIANPTKMEYISGETFDPTGMKIQATLENGTKENEITLPNDLVTYKKTELKPSDTNNFELSYGGCTFKLGIEVSSGAFIEAEAGLPITSGIKIAAGPTVQAIEEDLVNTPSTNGDGYYCLRGIDNGKTVYSDKHRNGPGEYLVDGIRCDLDAYVAEHPEWCGATGGYYVGSGAPRDNLVEFSGGKNAKLMYSLTGSANGSAEMIFRMSNPNIDGQTAPETKLNTVLKITVNGKEVAISDSVVLAAVDFTQYKAYNADTKEYDGKPVTPKYYWQTVSVNVDLIQGGNSIVVQSISDRTVRIDSISYKSTNVDLTNECNFAPEVVSAKLKVESEKLYLGLIVDAHELGYGEDGAKTVLALTKLNSSRAATWERDGEGNYGKDSDNDPWSQKKDNGGLGYDSKPASMENGTGFGKMIVGVTDVEKINEGKFDGMYCVWMELTPATDKYVGVYCLSGFSYGADYAGNRPLQSIVYTDEGATAELGDYCYQVYCDSRDHNVTFGWAELALVIQKGTFDSTKATADLPLCNTLRLRYLDYDKFVNTNDPELEELRKPAE